MSLLAETLSMSTATGCGSDSTGPVAGKERPRIPEGDYVAVCYRTRSVKSFGGRRKLMFYFRIVEGDQAGVELEMYCNYPSGRITKSHKLHRQWALAIGRFPSKGDKFAQNVFRGKMCRVLVRDAMPPFPDGTPVPEFLRYSVVDTIKEVLIGVPEHE